MEDESPELIQQSDKAALATGAWACPVLAWVATAFGAAVGRSAGFIGNALLALTQLGLLVAGLVLGIVVLTDKEARRNRERSGLLSSDWYSLGARLPSLRLPLSCLWFPTGRCIARILRTSAFRLSATRGRLSLMADVRSRNNVLTL